MTRVDVLNNAGLHILDLHIFQVPGSWIVNVVVGITFHRKHLRGWFQWIIAVETFSVQHRAIVYFR